MRLVIFQRFVSRKTFNGLFVGARLVRFVVHGAVDQLFSVHRALSHHTVAGGGTRKEPEVFASRRRGLASDDFGLHRLRLLGVSRQSWANPSLPFIAIANHHETLGLARADLVAKRGGAWRCRVVAAAFTISTSRAL